MNICERSMTQLYDPAQLIQRIVNTNQAITISQILTVY